jgi:hypothetical protein
MSSCPHLCRRSLRLLAAVFALALLPAAAAAAAALPEKGEGPLSPILAELADPAVAALPPAAQDARLGLPRRGPGGLMRDGRRILVRARFHSGAAVLREQVLAAGGRVLAASSSYPSASIAVPAAKLDALATASGIAALSPIRRPLLFATNCEGGSQISEGVGQLKAKVAREAFGLDGAGVEIGVLSDSYDRAEGAATDAAGDVDSGDLPGAASECSGQTTPVDVIEDLESEPGSDEGRAMLQIVHDMAPRASLAFATAFEGEEGFAKNIKKLAAAGADVIVDDVAYFEEPFFQDGPVAAAITKATGEGVDYLSAAGNNNLFDGEGNEIASWEAPEFRDGEACPPEVEALIGFNAFHCMDFNPEAATDRTFGIKVEPGETLSLDLQWAEPWEGVDTDLDAILLDANGKVLTGSNEDNLATQMPVEIVQWVNETDSTRTVQLAINKFAGPGARLKFILLQNGAGVSGVEYPRSGGGDVVGPSIFGHAGAASAIAVGAVPFNNSASLERYSSRGPVTHYFGQVKGATPASPLAEPELLSKPDIAATDCGRTTFFALFYAGVWRFCGTSAAAPHAAGAMALMRDAAPLAGHELLRESLIGTGSPIGTLDPCAIGGGLVETVAAVEAAREEADPVEPGSCVPPDASAAVFVAPGSWGSESPVPPPSPPPAAQGTAPQPPPPSPAVPTTRIVKHPQKVVRSLVQRPLLVFRFASDQANATYLCTVDRSRYRSCPSRFARRYGPGRHVLRVKARSPAGLLDAIPAVFRFRVVRR